jgi:hypothetical protein
MKVRAILRAAMFDIFALFAELSLLSAQADPAGTFKLRAESRAFWKLAHAVFTLPRSSINVLRAKIEGSTH